MPRTIASAQADTLRRLTLDDQALVGSVLGGTPRAPTTPTLDARTQALIRLGALIALGAGPAPIDRAVADAQAAGATPGDIIDVLLTVGPSVGAARLVGAAPRVATALGYDVEAALERFDAEP